jgi:hypothetical protein
MLWSPEGRLLLTLLLASLVPYAFTADIPGGAEWRFTLHAYPYFLIAAALGLTWLGRLVVAVQSRETLARRLTPPALRKLLVSLALVLAAWAAGSTLCYVEVREALGAGEAVHVEAGLGDELFFGSGWRRPERRWSITVRRSRGNEAVLWLPLAPGKEHALTLRVDPRADESADVLLEVYVEGVRISEVALQRDRRRIGAYALHLPSRLARGWGSQILLRARRAGASAEESAPPPRFLLWYARIEPV